MTDSAPPPTPTPMKIHVKLIHLDLGIGGAEQLMLQLAENVLEQQQQQQQQPQDPLPPFIVASVELITTKCDPSHCFDIVKPPLGRLYPHVTIWGSWIPHEIIPGTGVGRVLCSTIRLLFLTIGVIVRSMVHSVLSSLSSSSSSSSSATTTTTTSMSGGSTIPPTSTTTSTTNNDPNTAHSDNENDTNKYSNDNSNVNNNNNDDDDDGRVPVVSQAEVDAAGYPRTMASGWDRSNNSTTNDIDNHGTPVVEETIYIVDVLPIPLPFLRYFQYSTSSLLFYCHFPDQLLIRPTTTTASSSSSSSSSSIAATHRRHYDGSSTTIRFLKHCYRYVFNKVEELCFHAADLIVVNSYFTQQTVVQTFSSFRTQQQQQQQQQQQLLLPILYPALDTASIDHILLEISNNKHNNNNNNDDDDDQGKHATTTTPLIVSLNRYERKKNIMLLLDAIAYMISQFPYNNHNNHNPAETSESLSSSSSPSSSSSLPTSSLLPFKVIIAGGYDRTNIENVEYRIELEQYANQLQIRHYIEFQQSINDIDRVRLLQQASVVVYTPSQEHFGIVPLEAMYLGTPVVAVNSGGPRETILDQTTGYLCSPTPSAFGTAIHEIISNPTLCQQMSDAATHHVRTNFNRTKQQHELNALIIQCIQQRQQHRIRYHNDNSPVGMKAMEDGFMIACFLFISTWVLRTLGILHPNEALLSGIQRGFR
jgi:alpha-1,3/alpha-1,6-mannosyltransferase